MLAFLARAALQLSCCLLVPFDDIVTRLEHGLVLQLYFRQCTLFEFSCAFAMGRTAELTVDQQTYASQRHYLSLHLQLQ